MNHIIQKRFKKQNGDYLCFITLLAHIEISGSVHHKTNFLVRMQMLREERLQLVVVVRQTSLRAGYLVLVRVSALLANAGQNSVTGIVRHIQLEVLDTGGLSQIGQFDKTSRLLMMLEPLIADGVVVHEPCPNHVAVASNNVHAFIPNMCV